MCTSKHLGYVSEKTLQVPLPGEKSLYFRRDWNTSGAFTASDARGPFIMKGT